MLNKNEERKNTEHKGFPPAILDNSFHAVISMKQFYRDTLYTQIHRLKFLFPRGNASRLVVGESLAENMIFLRDSKAVLHTFARPPDFSISLTCSVHSGTSDVCHQLGVALSAN